MFKFPVVRFVFVFLVLSGFFSFSCSIIKTHSLDTAVRYKNVKEVRRHLNEGANPNTPNEAGQTQLHQAAQIGYLKVAEVLLERGASVDARDHEGRTPLHLAANRSHAPMVDLLIAQKARVNDRDKKGRTALHYAALEYHTEVARVLLSKGAVVDARDKKGETPLYLASLNNSSQIAELLIAKGAQVNPKRGPFPLVGAAREGNTRVARVLLNHKARVEGPHKAAKTPLHLAAERGGLDMVRLLLAFDAQPDSRDKAGKTPIYYSASQDHLRVMDELIRHGVNVNQKIPEGTLLHLAAEKGYVRAASILINKGAKLEMKNAKGKKPLDVAINHKNRRVADLILQETINQREADK